MPAIKFNIAEKYYASSRFHLNRFLFFTQCIEIVPYRSLSLIVFYYYVKMNRVITRLPQFSIFMQGSLFIAAITYKKTQWKLNIPQR